MKLIQKLVKSFWFGNYDADTFLDLHKEITDTNLFLMKRVSMAFVFITALPFIFALLIESLSGALVLYASLVIVSLLAQIVCRLYLPKHPRMVITIYQLFYFSLMSLAIILGITFQPDTPSVVICVLLAIMPIFMLDKPGKIALISLLPVTVFCVASLETKSHDIAVLECVNCLTFYVVGFFAGRHYTNTKIEEIITRNRLEHLSETDALTDLYTRGAIEKRIYNHLNQRHILSAMMYFDIDNFKQINDTFGHQYGDKILTDVASALKGVFRSTDYISRLGGDEFIVFLPSVPSKEWMEFKAGQVVELLNRTYTHDGKTRTISASLGLAFSENGQGTYDDLYKNADRAMYEAKHAGKNQFFIYDSALMN
ncbi:MAG TPA: GGDEF domain-containing protein [Oscillospiraceae bacterium]|nr:GGDEF domain-containing protein [Oscillospiraceae bacterium]HPF56654.1 GGDEF domain-containing protein [Clostridiales bacterium]HPK36579.1 GGDEF domain-containing protein [Oscillospiraceae bacterium]HPR76774.1 GGDEF domain-containing protein [Oscillospiraceae bacterium]